MIRDSDIRDLGSGFSKDFLDFFMQWPGSGEVFGLIVDLFSFSASLAYLTMLEPINELHVAMFAVFIFHNQINTYIIIYHGAPTPIIYGWDGMLLIY